MRTDFRYRSFDVNEIFQQRLNYEKHKRKLQELQSGTKFNIFPTRTEQIQRYRNNKHSTFLKELRDRSSSINKTNIRIFQRLAGATDGVRSTVQTPMESSTTFLPLKDQSSRKRKQQIEREHENQRMQIRLNVSSINTRKINDEYRRSLQIRNRITRYETNPLTHQVIPKAQKYSNINTASGTVRSADGKSSAVDSKHRQNISTTLGKIPPVAFDKEKKQRTELIRTSLAARSTGRLNEGRLRQGNISSFGRYKDDFESDDKDEVRLAQTARQHDEQANSDNLFPTQVQSSSKPSTAFRR